MLGFVNGSHRHFLAQFEQFKVRGGDGADMDDRRRAGHDVGFTALTMFLIYIFPRHQDDPGALAAVGVVSWWSSGWRSICRVSAAWPASRAAATFHAGRAAVAGGAVYHLALP